MTMIVEQREVTDNIKQFVHFKNFMSLVYHVLSSRLNFISTICSSINCNTFFHFGFPSRFSTVLFFREN